MKRSLIQFARAVEKELRVWRLVARHPRTPRFSKWCLAAAVAYALMPIDLIPDFIPLIGHLDDLLIVPGLVALGLRFVPRDVLAECRAAAGGVGDDQPH